MGKLGQERKKIINQIRQDFLMTFFEDHSYYQEKEVNGYWLVFTLANGGTKPQVLIYTKESYYQYKTFQEGKFNK